MDVTASRGVYDLERRRTTFRRDNTSLGAPYRTERKVQETSIKSALFAYLPSE